MSVGRESIRRAAKGAGKTVKKPVVSTFFAEEKIWILFRIPKGMGGCNKEKL